jgi:hypothetical protein
MGWPTANEYFEAIRHPPRRFCRPDLKRGQAAQDDCGKPVFRQGKSCDVYELRGAGGADGYAVGCFTREPVGVARRFQIINEHFQDHPLAALVHTEFVEQGIAIRGRWFPITVAHWQQGLPLREYVRQYLDHDSELRLVADGVIRLGLDLERAEAAHGNLCGETVLVEPSPGGGPLGLRLVDYDGIYVPGLAGQTPEELGHVDFQHPARAGQKTYDAGVDRFSLLVLVTALHALAINGRVLWDRHDNGENLLFTESDFQEPAGSALLRELWHSESKTLRALAGWLILASRGPEAEVPAIKWVADNIRPGAARKALTPEHVERIDAVMKNHAKALGINLQIDEAPLPAVAEPNGARHPVGTPNPATEGISVKPLGPPPLIPRDWSPASAEVPPPIPTDHPLLKTYEVDAWMPEAVALMKLRGFVRDVGGEVVSNVPGHFRVHILDPQDLAQPARPHLLSWLGFVDAAPKAPRVQAVMDVCMIHKTTPTRNLLNLTLRLSPGEDDAAPLRWDAFCDRIFCEFRGYVIGIG